MTSHPPGAPGSASASVVGPVFLMAQLERLPRTSAQQIEDRTRRRELLALHTAEAEQLWPARQCARNQPFTGLGAVLDAFGDRVDRWTLISWLRTPLPSLGTSVIERRLAHEGNVLAALEQGDHELTGPVRLVAANVAMLERALTDDGLSVPALLEWHRILSAGEKSGGGAPGELRRQPGWIGGHFPLDAAVVLPPPEFVAELLDDLVSFVRDAEDDPLTVAAVAHAQFEPIHPFADGNGRLGRALVSRALTERLGLVVPPPISRSILADRGGYVAGLTSYRFVRWDDWVGWFADVVRKSAEQ